MERQELQDLAIRLALGEIDPRDHEKTRALLARDAEVAELERLVREAVESMRTDQSVSAPLHVREAAKRLMSGPAARADWIRELTKVVSAWIPSPTLDGMPGYRGPGDDGLAEYSSDAGRVHLMVSPPEEGDPRWRVRGVIDSNRGPATEVAFVRTDGDRGVAGHARVEPDGKFRVDVARGVFDVYVRLGDAALEIKELRIG